MIRITPVVKQLIIINVLFFIGSLALNNIFYGFDFEPFKSAGRYALGAFYLESDYFRPYQIVTHMFMHADGGHILFNMFILYMFGSLLEQRLEAKRFLTLYLLSGLGALIFQMLFYAYEVNFLGMNNMNANMLGASGAVMGVLGAVACFFPNQMVQLIIPPIPMKMKYMVLGLVVIDLYMGVNGNSMGIARFAHVGGALVGFLIAYYWKRQRYV